MATSKVNQEITLVAAADLSSSQYYIVQVDSDGKAAAISSVTHNPIGILQNSPVTGQAARIAPLCSGGVSKIVLGGTLDEGARVSPGATGKAVTAASASYPVGTLLEGGADTEIGSVLLAPTTLIA